MVIWPKIMNFFIDLSCFFRSMKSNLVQALAICAGAIFVTTIIGFPSPTVAAGLGISGARLDIELEPDSKHQHIVTLVRSHPEEDEEYSVDVRGDGAEFVSVREGNLVVLPRGERTSEFTIDINTANAPLGNYEARVEFLPAKELEHDSGGILNIIQGVSVNVTFDIVEQLTAPPEVIDISNNPNKVLKIELTSVDNGDALHGANNNVQLLWQISNIDDRPYINIPYTYEIYRGNEQVSSESKIYAKELKAGGVGKIEESYQAVESGSYRVVLSVGDLEEVIEFEIARAGFTGWRFYLAIIAVALFSGLGLSIIVKSKKSSASISGKPFGLGLGRATTKSVFSIVIILVVVGIPAWVVYSIYTTPYITEGDEGEISKVGIKSSLLVMDSKENNAYLLDTKSGERQKFEGEWTFYSAGERAIFAVPKEVKIVENDEAKVEDGNGDKENEDPGVLVYYLTYPQVRQYYLTDLPPGPIRNITLSVNNLYILIEGLSESSNQPYFCAIDATESGEPECKFIEEEASVAQSITGVMWGQKGHNIIIFTNSENYLYDLWLGTTEVVFDETLAPTAVPEKAENIINTYMPMKRWFGYATEFSDSQQYRLPFAAEFAQLEGRTYLMSKLQEGMRELYLFDAEEGGYHFIDTYSPEAAVIYLEEGKFSTSPLM